MFIVFSCALIGHRRNDVRDLIGAKTTKRKECYLNVTSRLWGGALRDDTKNGCEGDYFLSCCLSLWKAPLAAGATVTQSCSVTNSASSSGVTTST